MQGMPALPTRQASPEERGNGGPGFFPQPRVAIPSLIANQSEAKVGRSGLRTLLILDFHSDQQSPITNHRLPITYVDVVNADHISKI